MNRLQRLHPRANEFVVVIALAALMLVVGWRVLLLMKTVGGDGGPASSGRQAAVSGADYLVFSTYRVVDRGPKDWANDDKLEYGYYRYPLTGGRPELIAQVTADNGKGLGSPWMRPLSPDTLLFVRRNSGADDFVWIDVAGRELPRPLPPDDSGVDGLPSPDGSRVAYVDPAKRSVTVLTAGSLLQTFDIKGAADVGFWSPLSWSPDGRRLYLKPVFEGGGFVSGLWVIDLERSEAAEIKAFRRLGLVDVDIDPRLGLGVGVTFRGDGLGTDIAGPSKVHLVDLETGADKVLLSDDSLVFRGPLLSPDGRRLAFSYAGDESDVWLMDIDSALSSLLVSGRALAWTPDSRSLVVSRNDEIQLVEADSRSITTVARRVGKYYDPDFQGLEFIGLVKGKNQ